MGLYVERVYLNLFISKSMISSTGKSINKEKRCFPAQFDTPPSSLKYLSNRIVSYIIVSHIRIRQTKVDRPPLIECPY